MPRPVAAGRNGYLSLNPPTLVGMWWVHLRRAHHMVSVEAGWSGGSDGPRVVARTGSRAGEIVPT